MNQKKAKQLRQALRKMGVNPSNKVMIYGQRPIKGGGFLEGTYVLKKDCGRKVYQLAKQEAMSHGFSK